MATIYDALLQVPLAKWLCVIMMMVVQRVSRYFGLWPYTVVALPGTLAHELAHYAVAQLLWARPRLPRLWPEHTPQGWRLGSVAFVAPWWRAMPIALAPLLLAPIALAWVLHFVAAAQGPWLALHAWIAATVFGASLPSRADWRIAAPGLLAAVLVGTAVWGLWRYAG